MVLPTIIQLLQKWLYGKNAQAYLSGASAMKKKKFCDFVSDVTFLLKKIRRIEIFF
jgi:hypothetical protein